MIIFNFGWTMQKIKNCNHCRKTQQDRCFQIHTHTDDFRFKHGREKPKSKGYSGLVTDEAPAVTVLPWWQVFAWAIRWRCDRFATVMVTWRQVSTLQGLVPGVGSTKPRLSLTYTTWSNRCLSVGRSGEQTCVCVRNREQWMQWQSFLLHFFVRKPG